MFTDYLAHPLPLFLLLMPPFSCIYTYVFFFWFYPGWVEWEDISKLEDWLHQKCQNKI